jgi:hypothetical protein
VEDERWTVRDTARQSEKSDADESVRSGSFEDAV